MTTDVFVIAQSPVARFKAFEIVDEIRRNRIRALCNLNDRSMKAQMREANRLEAKFVYIIGETELAEGAGSLKDMQSGEQNKISFDRIVEEIRNRLPIS
jgi:histidyl-tRNA synthetase